MKYRLPDWLGGHEVEVVESTGDGWLAVCTLTQIEGARQYVSIPHHVLVEVKPPSIDDPVTLPLTMQIHPGADDDSHELMVEGSNFREYGEGYIRLTAGDGFLTAEQCRDAARALWLLGTREQS